MKTKQGLKRLGRVSLWLAYPLYGPFTKGMSLLRTGSHLVRNLPELTTDGATETVEALTADIQARTRAQVRTRNYGVFCGVLLMLMSMMWLYDVFWEKQFIFGPVCIETAAVIIMLSGQFLALSFSNWTIRRGWSGSFSEFMSNGKNLWPR
ncbi:hypothetical protein GOB86_12605 [Acetobacter lambici]|uniref:Uncharacterized protein n=1 Tax=Acetobacter lambici TaxID=1332824 RepID=A0ABT1F148_9PROT|nr:hypothetical protein [Acetobacter lambici]MCP1242767.1 hypothetical protein [Acetobacter lambici]MCP1258937.1 hypothetical protein [Acetobacter lambici]NHO57885.1 hypothetical protein [Acetobacter lambici]